MPLHSWPSLMGDLAEELETISVVDPGTEVYTDTDGIQKERPLTALDVDNVDLQPVGGSARLLPEGVRATATHQAFIELATLSDLSRGAVRNAIKAGRTIERADGSRLVISWVGDWDTHLVVALRGK